MSIQDSALGRPMMERIEFIKNLDPIQSEGNIVIFSGHPDEKSVPYYMVDIDFPIYRLQNIRTKSPQTTYVVKNSVPKDFFIEDPESREALAVQHLLLLRIAESGDESRSHTKTFEKTAYDKNHPMMMTHDGILINGNTRMSALRELYFSDPVRYERFAKIPIAVLPSSLTPKDYRRLELNLQIRPDIFKKYPWLSEAQDCLEQISNGASIEFLEDEYSRAKKDVSHPANLIDQIKFADKFLELIEQEGNYDLVEDAQYPLWAWSQWSKTYNHDPNIQSLIDEICCQLIQSKSGNVYKDIQQKQREFSRNPSLFKTVVDKLLIDTDPSQVQSDNLPEHNQEKQETSNSTYDFLNEIDSYNQSEEINSENIEAAVKVASKSRLKRTNETDEDDEEPSTNKDESALLTIVNDTLATEKEIAQRGKNLKLIYSDAVSINESIEDCIRRIKDTTNEFTHLNEARSILAASKDRIDELVSLLDDRLGSN